MKVLIDDKIPFIKGVLEPFIDVEYIPGKEITKEKAKNADALIIRTRTKCNRSLLEGTEVKYIATATIGYDHIDTEYCKNNGITWTNAPGCNSYAVQQYIASALIFLSKKHGFRLKDKTLGIIGVGNVGKKVLRIAEYLGMRIVINDPPRERVEGPCGFVSMNGILREADILSFHVPLNISGEDKTFHMVNSEFIDKVIPGTMILNSSRGEVVDTNALKQALKKGIIKAAVMDVWENEPVIDKELLDLTDIATPHIAGYSQDGKANGTSMVVKSFCEHFNLPYSDWYPDELTPVTNNILEIDCEKKDTEESIAQALEFTYDIKQDDHKLRKSPGLFEELRGNYPVRREYNAYKVNLKNATIEVKRLLSKLRFEINEV